LTTSRLLFVTWDGPQVAYLESLYMPVFARLAVRGHTVHVLQFTWADAARRDAIARACERGGATYRSAAVLRRPVAVGGLATALLGARHVAREIERHRIDVVMPRSTLPALATTRALRQCNSRVRMLLDADGLPHDERVDFGGWSADGVAYRLLRDLEASAVRRADVVLTRSRRASEILAARAGPGIDAQRFVVVGNGRDPSRFTPGTADGRRATRERLGVAADVPLLVYAGSIGTQYCVPQMLAFLRRVRARRPDTRLLLLTGSPEEARGYLDAAPDLQPATIVRRVPADEVPALLAAADLGLAMREPSFSMQAVAPIKLGEYLLCGLPVLATRAIGDSESLLPDHVGCLLDTHAAPALDSAAAWFTDHVLAARDTYRTACREQGLRAFALDGMVETFERAIAQAMDAQS